MLYDVEIKYQPEESKFLLGSPSICRAPDGNLIASHDYNSTNSTKSWNPNRHFSTTEIYRSTDNGVTWQNITHIDQAFWGTLFVLQNKLWLISCSCEYGDIVIRCSEDNGWTWNHPCDRENGLLFLSGDDPAKNNWHFGGATPVCVYNGRIYKAVEDHQSGESWNPSHFAAAVISAPVDADLLRAENWTMSNKVCFDIPSGKAVMPELIDDSSGWLEGNIVPLPDNSGLVNLMRFHTVTGRNAAILQIADEGRKLSFDYSNGIIPFPGGHAKFTIRRDPVSGLYYTVSNVVDCIYAYMRNRLAPSWSADLRTWFTCPDIMYDDSGLKDKMSKDLTGFMYPDWQFDGDDVVITVRVAYRGAPNFHDSNRIWFKRIKDFRKTIPDELK